LTQEQLRKNKNAQMAWFLGDLSDHSLQHEIKGWKVEDFVNVWGKHDRKSIMTFFLTVLSFKHLQCVS